MWIINNETQEHKKRNVVAWASRWAMSEHCLSFMTHVDEWQLYRFTLSISFRGKEMQLYQNCISTLIRFWTDWLLKIQHFQIVSMLETTELRPSLVLNVGQESVNQLKQEFPFIRRVLLKGIRLISFQVILWTRMVEL